ncbi:hypothetical protein [Actinobacillus porcinus]|uniref:hypothetical protein n=1 Tax=Actinobacillus porcinus TaxID=51048 RepID=UPI0023F2D0DA|nr:hypothetical protein [Actinobacillus porcinus]MDD7545370.1 hypothetical protein [Actinobacillus porcinus]
MEILVLNSIPQNSWLVDLTNKKAYIGNNVRKLNNSEFFEGGWAHTLSPFSESDTCIRFGSGFKIEDKNVTFFTPNHSLEGIYTIKKDNELYVSNSLAFVMPQFKKFIFKDGFKMKDMARPLWRLTEGLKSYPRKILCNNHLEINRYLFCKIEITIDLNISELIYKTPYSFKDFSSYKNFLVETISQTAKNAKAIEIASYLSKGYDSVACSALAKLAGGNLTLSVKTSRDGFIDSGVDIAQKLGMRSVEFNRKKRDTIEKKFDWGSTNFEIIKKDEVHNFEFFVGLNFEDEVLYTDYNLHNHIVLTGFNGDVLWGMNKPVDNNLSRTETSGSSIYEFRLRQGFTHIPIALILNQISSNIRDISYSKEMEKYVIEGTNYNRPIPRRIAEEMGVDRHQFGMKKTAASTMVENLDEFRDDFFHRLMKRYEIS